MKRTGALRAFYFLYYAGVGVTLPYFSIYLDGLGLSGAELGLVQTVQPLLAAPAGLAWAAVADRKHAARGALIASTAIVALAYLALPAVRTPAAMAALFAIVGLGGAGIVPLVDAICVETAGAGYARTRLFGSIGYVVAAQGLGLLLSARGDRRADVAIPLAMLASAAACALVATFVPRAPGEHPPPRVRDALQLLKRPGLGVLFAFAALHWMDSAPYNLLFGLFVRESNLPSSVVGLGSGLGVAAEVGVLAFASRLEARFPARTLFAISFGATAVRWALLWRASGAVAIVALQLLHGATFGLFWATVVRALRDLVPAPLRATGQALFGALVFQVGSAIANPLTGAALDHTGRVAPLFAAAALIELVPLVLLVAWHPRRA